MTMREPQDFFARRVKSAKPSPTLAVSQGARELKAAGIDVVDLGGGDPDFITPEHIRKAAIEAMNAGDTHYVSSQGTPALLKAIANKLRVDNGIEVDEKKGILVTPGGKSALFQACMAFVEPGVAVMMLDPFWVSYKPAVEVAGGIPIHVNLDPDVDFKVTREALDDAWNRNVRVLIINSPNNPSGRVLTRDELQIIADFAIENDILVFSDEIYEKIVFDDNEHISIATLPGMAERTLTFNGLSKAYAMTGWRLGWVAGPVPFINKIGIIHSHSVTCATSFAQAGAVAAYEGPQDIIHDMVAAWDRRRHLVTDGINAINGLHVQPIEGAFYAFVDGRGTGMHSETLAKKILDEAHVAVVPGTAFGYNADGHFRMSFATSDEDLQKTIERLTDLFGKRGA